MLFNGGVLDMTSGVMDALGPAEVSEYVMRHMRGDWGDLCDDDKKTNERSLKNGGMLFSSYDSDTHETVYVITDPHAGEDGGAVTTIMLWNEY